ncbi:hypothetical protein D3C87_1854020 [compost metagenome]
MPNSLSRPVNHRADEAKHPERRLMATGMILGVEIILISSRLSSAHSSLAEDRPVFAAETFPER